jgi:uncharacterized membrane protein
MKKTFTINLLVVLVGLSPIIYLLTIWQSIPDTIEAKFEFGSTFEETHGKDALMISTVVVALVGVLLFLVMRNLHRVDPKVNEATPRSTFNKLGAILLIFLTCWNYLFVITSLNNSTIDASIIFAGVGLLITVAGNYMNNLKPNYVAGIRLPWTLNDPENWRLTHRLASKVWFVGGLTLMFISLVLPQHLFIPLFTVVIVILVVVPGVYSFRMYRNKSNS